MEHRVTLKHHPIESRRFTLKGGAQRRLVASAATATTSANSSTDPLILFLQTQLTAMQEPPLSETAFAFLLDPSWITEESSCQNYVTLIGKQDTFFGLVANHMRTKIGITEKSTDKEILNTIGSLTPEIATGILAILKAAVNTVCLGPLPLSSSSSSSSSLSKETCAPSAKSKFDDLFSMNRITGTLQKTSSQSTIDLQTTYILTKLFLYPALFKNITIQAIGEIIKTLMTDEATQELLKLPPPGNTLPHHFLIDKYSTYIVSSSYSLTSQEAYDYLYLWGCFRKGFAEWEKFIQTFLMSIGSSDETGNEFITASTENKGIKHLPSDDSSDRFGKITALLFKRRDESLETILKFIADSPSLVTGRDSVPTRGVVAIAQATDVIGLPPVSEHKKSLFASDGGGSVTFESLLKKLTIGEIHYIIHLKTILDEQKQKVEVKAPVETPVETPVGTEETSVE